MCAVKSQLRLYSLAQALTPPFSKKRSCGARSRIRGVNTVTLCIHCLMGMRPRGRLDDENGAMPCDDGTEKVYMYCGHTAERPVSRAPHAAHTHTHTHTALTCRATPPSFREQVPSIAEITCLSSPRLVLRHGSAMSADSAAAE